jgi:hypothetical protein
MTCIARGSYVAEKRNAFGCDETIMGIVMRGSHLRRPRDCPARRHGRPICPVGRVGSRTLPTAGAAARTVLGGKKVMVSPRSATSIASKGFDRQVGIAPMEPSLGYNPPIHPISSPLAHRIQRGERTHQLGTR